MLKKNSFIYIFMGFSLLFLTLNGRYWALYANTRHVEVASPFKQPVPTPLTNEEYQYALTAWRYFEKNMDPNTGLVSSTSQFPSMTLWDEAGYLFAIMIAYRFKFISRDDALYRLEFVIKSLSGMKLFADRLPNKAYNTKNVEMSNYSNKPTNIGIGWSALDLMRFFAGLLAISQEFPEIKLSAQKLIDKWDMLSLVNKGRFQGISLIKKGNSRLVQEGRIGYEQYAGTIGLRMGMPVALAAQYEPILRVKNFFGSYFPADKRRKDKYGIEAIVTSEPFILEALEFGWRPDLFAVARAVYNAHVLRYQKTGILTSLSEDHMEGPPYFAYHSILVGDKPFRSVTSQYKDASDKRGFSTKAAFGWWALMRDDYTELLIEKIKNLQTEGGWYTGFFEATGKPNKVITMNTNAVVMEALYYKAFGPIIK